MFLMEFVRHYSATAAGKISSVFVVVFVFIFAVAVRWNIDTIKESVDHGKDAAAATAAGCFQFIPFLILIGRHDPSASVDERGIYLRFFFPGLELIYIFVGLGFLGTSGSR